MTNDIASKIKCITDMMADEMEAYEEYMEYAEKYKTCPAIHDLYTKNANDEKRHFDDLYSLLQEYMNDLKDEMSKKTTTVSTSQHPIYGRRS